MKLIPGLLLLIVAAGLAGCDGSSVTGSSSQAQTGPKTGGVKPVVGEELKHEAYHWYGLANDKPIKMRVDLSDGRTYTGTQTITLKSAAAGKATYDVTRTDGLQVVFGDESVSLEKDGVFTVSSTKLKGDTRNIEMPSSLPPGATWTNAGKLETTDNQAMQPNQTYSVVRQETVTTKAGSASALLIVSKGDSLLGGKKYRMETSNWYVKDKGLVKAEIRLTDLSNKKAKPQVITIQETK